MEPEPGDRGFKYYFKSPEELRGPPPVRRPGSWLRNRGRLVLIADVLILLLVFAILQLRGSFVRRDAPSNATVRIGALDVSAAFPGATTRTRPRLYVTLRNTGTTPVMFPGTGPYALRAWQVVFARSDNSRSVCLAQSEPPIQILPQRSGDLTLECPPVAAGKVDLTLRIVMEGTQWELSFPTVMIGRAEKP